MTSLLLTITSVIIIAQKPPKRSLNPTKGNKGETKEKNKHDTPISISPTPLPSSTPILPTIIAPLLMTPNIKDSEPVPSNLDTTSDNQCCSNDCCVSLTYSRSISKKENLLPQLNSDGYFCENMDISTTGNCDIDFIVFPLSSHCDLQQTIYSLRWVTQSEDAIGYERAVLDNDIITPNNAETLYMSPTDENNPISGFDALKFPVNAMPNQQISVCTLVRFGEIVENINNQNIHIGYMGVEHGFACSNATVRDICSVNNEVSNVLFDAKKMHFAYDNGKFELEYNGHKYTNTQIIVYFVIFVVFLLIVAMCIFCLFYQSKRSNGRNIGIGSHTDASLDPVQI